MFVFVSTMLTFIGPSCGIGRIAVIGIVWPAVNFWTLFLLSSNWAPRQRPTLHLGVAAVVGTSSRGVVPSAMTAAKAPAPQAALIAEPGSLAAGDVMLPWAKALVISNAVVAARDLTTFMVILLM